MKSVIESVHQTMILAGNIPGSFQLHQNYPNPFNPVTTIPLSIPEKSDVTIDIYDIRGRLIETVYDQSTQPGDYSIIWNAENVASGNYFIVQ